MQKLVLLFTIAVIATGTCLAQTSKFTYQGRLTDGGVPANGNYDFQIGLYNSDVGGAEIGTTNSFTNIPVTAGIFTIELDFGPAAFPGANRWLDITARTAGVGAYNPLQPRQPITSIPYAVRSLVASSVESVPVSAVPAGNGNYIQNTSSVQATANFNISGDGTAGGTLSANAINANTQLNLAGVRVVSNPGPENMFVGVGAGGANTTGQKDSFFGQMAGGANTTGNSNSFFGQHAGQFNTQGSFNSFFGQLTGA